MKTIAASDGAYGKVMDKKSEMEKRKGARRVVPMADALDELLKEGEGEGEGE